MAARALLAAAAVRRVGARGWGRKGRAASPLQRVVDAVIVEVKAMAASCVCMAVVGGVELDVSSMAASCVY